LNLINKLSIDQAKEGQSPFLFWKSLSQISKNETGAQSPDLVNTAFPGPSWKREGKLTLPNARAGSGLYFFPEPGNGKILGRIGFPRQPEAEVGAAADPIKLRVGNAGPVVFPVSGGHPVVGAAVYDERGAGDGGQVELGNGPNLDRVVL